ncbi:MAG TPA: pyridoxamine 5'-phosphate oxidase family protein [Hyphomonadaceae bacterium]|jgi:predicted pyridoxine 5'-phosphate oxidase superfamily flavin-nucleotide-binding protein|nr:pyridoxamine 5'-phosphate oxidase family protein [Hyphomonadaceae bacterium]
MTSHFLNVVSTPAVKAIQAEQGSRTAYSTRDGETARDQLTESEAGFIATRDSFYMASVGETGWPYIQHRGGAPGFVKVLSPTQIAFADFRGNRQYVSAGNLSKDDRAALFFMDYPSRTRLKLLGHVRTVDLAADPDLTAQLIDPTYRAKIERAFVIDVEAFDWNCPQHITPRYTLEELEPAIGALKARIAELEKALAKAKQTA